MQDLPNGGGGGRTPSPKGASRVGLCGTGVLIPGGGADPSIGPRALETLGTPLMGRGVTRHLAHETRRIARLGPRDETSRETYDVICTLLIMNTNVL